MMHLDLEDARTRASLAAGAAIGGGAAGAAGALALITSSFLAAPILWSGAGAALLAVAGTAADRDARAWAFRCGAVAASGAALLAVLMPVFPELTYFQDQQGVVYTSAASFAGLFVVHSFFVLMLGLAAGACALVAPGGLRKAFISLRERALAREAAAADMKAARNDA